MSVIVDGSNGLIFNDASTQTTAATGFGFKNRIINGAMIIDQRNAGASVTPNGAYTLDRWLFSNSQTGKATVQQNAASVTPPAGFVNYAGITSASAYSITSTDYFLYEQAIEGLNVTDFGWGTANAQPITISFWVRSSLTGTFGGSVNNNAQNRTYPFAYTISASNTWEQKSITILGDTTGTWLTTNGIGMRLRFSLGTGATYSSTAGAWTSTSLIFAPTGATSVVGTNGATFYITGVQLEKGSTATAFDYRDFGRELALCQRYFTKSFATTTAPANSSVAPYEGVGASFAGAYVSSNFVPFLVTMRAVPTLTYYSSGNGTPANGVWQIYDGGWANAGSFNGSNITVNGFQNSWYYASATLKSSYYISGHFTASAEI